MDAEVGVDVVWRRGGVCHCVPGGAGAREGGAGAPCVFQRLRLGGKALDGELARLVPRAVLTSARTDAVIPLRARAFPPAPLSLKAEFRPRTTFPYAFRPFRERRGPFLLTDATSSPFHER